MPDVSGADRLDDLFPGLYTKYSLSPLSSPLPRITLNIGSSIEIEPGADTGLRCMLIHLWTKVFMQPLERLDPDLVEYQVMVA